MSRNAWAIVAVCMIFIGYVALVVRASDDGGVEIIEIPSGSFTSVPTIGPSQR